MPFENPKYPVNDPMAMLYLGSVFSFWLYPLVNMPPPKASDILYTPQKSSVQLVVYIVAFCSFIGSVYFSQYISYLFKNLGEVRVDIVTSEIQFQHFLSSMIMTQCAVCFFPFAVIFFYWGIIEKWDFRLLFLLFIGSFSETFHILSFVGRDGFLQYIFLSILSFSFFRFFMSEQVKTKIKKNITLITLFIAGVILSITISRSRGSAYQYTNALYHLCIDYMAQMPRYFNSFFESSDLFPLPSGYETLSLRRFFGYSLEREVDIITSQRVRYYFDMYGHHPNVFGTFLETFLREYGKMGTVLISLICSFLVNTMARKTKHINSVTYSVLSIFYSFFIMINIFYNRFLINPSGVIMVFLIICFYLYYKERESPLYLDKSENLLCKSDLRDRNRTFF